MSKTTQSRATKRDDETWVKISEIHVPRRIRKHMGDIESLMANIDEVGLLHPLPVRREGKRIILVAGARRLEACKRLGWERVPVHFVQVKDFLKAEMSENTQRLALLPTEIYDFVKEIEPQVREESRRQGRPKKGAKSAPFLEGKVRDNLAQICGMSHTTLGNLRFIMETVEANPGVPELEEVVKEMDRQAAGNGKAKIDRHHKTVKLWVQAQEDAKTVEGIAKKYHAERWGVNKITCGKAEDILPTIPSDLCHAAVIDAPFGVGKVYDGWQEPSDPESYWQWFEPKFREVWRIVRPGGFVGVFQDYRYRWRLPRWFGPFVGQEDQVDLFLFCKHWCGRGGASVIPLYDPIVVLRKPGGFLRPAWTPLNNWLYSPMKFDALAMKHPCPKPLDLLETLLQKNVVENGLVLDCFAGVGSLPLACRRTGRNFIAIEQSKKFCEIAEQRLALYGDPGTPYPPEPQAGEP